MPKGVKSRKGKAASTGPVIRKNTARKSVGGLSKRVPLLTPGSQSRSQGSPTPSSASGPPRSASPTQSVMDIDDDEEVSEEEEENKGEGQEVPIKDSGEQEIQEIGIRTQDAEDEVKIERDQSDDVRHFVLFIYLR
jgi:hypothetical protein